MSSCQSWPTPLFDGEVDQAGPSDPLSSLSIDARTITMERGIDERLRRQIEDADKDQPG